MLKIEEEKMVKKNKTRNERNQRVKTQRIGDDF